MLSGKVSAAIRADFSALLATQLGGAGRFDALCLALNDQAGMGTATERMLNSSESAWKRSTDVYPKPSSGHVGRFARFDYTAIAQTPSQCMIAIGAPQGSGKIPGSPGGSPRYLFRKPA